MGKCFKYLVITCASIMSFACTNLDDDLSVVTPKGAEITITASREGFEPNTRTIRESDGSVEWCPLDEISVFYSNGASGGSKFTSQNTEQAAIAEFRGRLEGISAGGEDFTDGKYLYASNRLKEDGISIFSVDKRSGLLEKIGYINTGIHPRNFTLSPDGKFIIVAERDSNRIEVFSRDKRTGLLTATPHKAELSMPVFVMWGE